MGTSLAALLCALPLAAVDPLSTAPRAEEPAPLTEEERALHLLLRFTPGPTPALLREAREMGLRPWLERQLRGDFPEDEALATRVAALRNLGRSGAEIAEGFRKARDREATPAERREARREAARPLLEMGTWILLRGLNSNRPVREVACDFFRNHFSVSAEKGQVRFLVAGWEREVIHRRSLGRFGDLLEASARHPAMLFYLDNHLSRRPAGPEEVERLRRRLALRTGSEERAAEAVDIARQRGLNENYARELLELHTLGVDNGYRQEDVVQVAKALTGWTIRRRGEEAMTFEFNPRMHAAGAKAFLGETISEDPRGPGEGERILEILEGRPGTARFLSAKLCRWFANDEPDPAMVERVAQAWEKSGGDIPSVFAAIADDPEFFSRRNYLAKFKRPFEFVLSALRACGARVEGPVGIQRALASMSEPLYRCPDPTGYYDQAEAWRDPGAMAVRWTFASDLLQGRVAGARVPASFYADLSPDRPEEWKDRLVEKILPVQGAGPATSAALDRIVRAELAKGSPPTPAGLGASIACVLLGSPEFQRQ